MIEPCTTRSNSSDLVRQISVKESLINIRIQALSAIEYLANPDSEYLANPDSAEYQAIQPEQFLVTSYKYIFY